MIYFLVLFFGEISIWHASLAIGSRVSSILAKFDFLFFIPLSFRSNYLAMRYRIIWTATKHIRMSILLARVSILCQFDSHEHLDIRFICICENFFSSLSLSLSLFWGVCIAS